MFLNYKFSSRRSFIKEDNPSQKKCDTHILKKPQRFMQWQARCKKPPKPTHFYTNHHPNSPPVNLYIQMHPETYTYTTLLMLYTLIDPPLFFFNNFLCKAFIETKKKDVRLTWGREGKIITLDIQLKCNFLNLQMFNKTSIFFT